MHNVSFLLPESVWHKANIAAAATMGGAPASALIRSAVLAMLQTLADRDPTLRTQFEIIDAGGLEAYEAKLRSEAKREVVTA